MSKLAVILGSNALVSGAPLEHVVENAGAVPLQRHGDPYVPPHAIDHGANLKGLAGAGCDRILAIGSVGSLSEQLPVGSFLCPDDFIALDLGATTIFNDGRGHRLPGFDPAWRRQVLAAWPDGEPAARDGGVYWQTVGPRFETPAEIRLMAPHADVVGMTIAPESTIAGELGIPYAAVCVVDNLANGIGPGRIGAAELAADRRANARRLADALEAALPALTGAASA